MNSLINYIVLPSISGRRLIISHKLVVYGTQMTQIRQMSTDLIL